MTKIKTKWVSKEKYSDIHENTSGEPHDELN